MITHEVPGDSFWDLIRKGAQAAADKDNIELRYSNDLRPRTRPPGAVAIDIEGQRHRGDAGIPDAVGPAIRRPSRQEFRWWRSTRARINFGRGCA